jgi:exocyst complex component 5
MHRADDSFAQRATKSSGLLSFETLKQGFIVEGFLASLMKDVFQTKKNDGRGAAEVATNFKLSLDKVHRLLRTFERVEAELETLHTNATQKVVQLQYDVGSDESDYRGEVKQIERGLESAKDSFRQLDSHMVRVSQTATRIGDRLQTADTLRSRAEETEELLGHLQQFSMLDEDDEEFRSLPMLFYSEGELPVAAATTRRLVALVQEVQQAKQRTRIGAEEQREMELIVPGSLEYTVMRLEEYCSWLENRVTTRFDRAAQEKNLGVMAECAHIMAQFDRERALIQRYVASRPVFLEAKEDWFASAALTAEDNAERLKPLQYLYRELVAAVKEEVGVIQAVFASAKMAMELLMQRIFEERIQVALDRVLPLPGARASADAIRMYMRLIADAYERTNGLVAQMEKNGGGMVDLSHVADGLFSAFLTDYPAMELRWLQLSYDHEARVAESGDLSRELASKLLEWNAEAVARCARLVPGSQAARAVRQLFHASSYVRAHTGCLLEQLARHIIGGVEYSLELCVAGGITTATALGIPNVSRALCAQLADGFVNERIRKVLEATRVAGEMMGMLQLHFHQSIHPHVGPSISEASACVSGLAFLLKAVEDTVLAVLRKCLDSFFGQVEKVLLVEQRRTDFLPKDDAMPNLERPTTACLLLTAMLQSLHIAAEENLEAANAGAFRYEVGSRTLDVLTAHMQRFVYSPLGALQWKKDVAEYAEHLQQLEVPAVSEKMAQLQSLLNVLVVAPESLLGLVNGMLRISHKEVLKYIALRDDFKAARVEGKTLAQLFNEEGMEDPVPGRGSKPYP